MNKLILLTLTFLITTPLIAMEEGAGLEGPLKRLKLEGTAPALAQTITVKFEGNEQADFDKNILMQSEMIQAAFRFQPDRSTISLENFTKDQFMQAYQLMEYAKNNKIEEIIPALVSKYISEQLSILWPIFDYLEVPQLQKKIRTHLEPILASAIDTNPDSIPDLLTNLPESFKQDKFSIPFSSKKLPKNLVNPSFNELATLQHGNFITSVAFDPQHNLLATGSVDKMVKIYNSSDLNNNSQPIATLQHDDWATSIAFDPANSLLAIGLRHGTVKIYNSSDLNNNSQPIATLQHDDHVSSVAFDPALSLLATGSKSRHGTVKIYNSSDLNNNSQPIATLKDDRLLASEVFSVSFDSLGSLLAIATGSSSSNVNIYNSSNLNNNSKPIATLKQQGEVHSIAFDPANSLLAMVSFHLKIYNSSHLTNDSKPIATLKAQGGVDSIAFDPANSLLAVGSGDRTAKIYNSADLNNDSDPIATLKEQGEVRSIAFDPANSLLAVGSHDGTVKIFKISEPILRKLTNEQGLAVLYLLRTKPESLTNVPEVIQQIITTIDKETWSTISEYLKPE